MRSAMGRRRRATMTPPLMVPIWDSKPKHPSRVSLIAVSMVMKITTATGPAALAGDQRDRNEGLVRPVDRWETLEWCSGSRRPAHQAKRKAAAELAGKKTNPAHFFREATYCDVGRRDC
jgi:hypothetical protein